MADHISLVICTPAVSCPVLLLTAFVLHLSKTPSYLDMYVMQYLDTILATLSCLSFHISVLKL